jgi:hypothetical protein
VTAYKDIDEARAAAERLAESRRWAISENTDPVRLIHVDWERGEFTSTAWEDPEIEYVLADGLGSWTGLEGIAEGSRDRMSAWGRLANRRGRTPE